MAMQSFGPLGARKHRRPHTHAQTHAYRLKRAHAAGPSNSADLGF